MALVWMKILLCLNHTCVSLVFENILWNYCQFCSNKITWTTTNLQCMFWSLKKQPRPYLVASLELLFFGDNFHHPATKGGNKSVKSSQGRFCHYFNRSKQTMKDIHKYVPTFVFQNIYFFIIIIQLMMIYHDYTFKLCNVLLSLSSR